MMEKMGWRLGIDIGGTFTDLYLINETTGEFRTLKVLSTSSPEKGVVEGLDRLLAGTGLSPGWLRLVAHGTTLATNALVERKGARVGVITTAGFRDVLVMGRQYRYDMQDLLIDLPRPPVRRADILGIPERVDASGQVVVPLNEEAVREAGRSLLGRGVESIAVCFLHSYSQPRHEQKAAALLRDEFALRYVSASSEVAPTIREYERFVTAVVNAYVQPLVDRYLGTLEGKIRAMGIEAPLLIMLNNGGLAMPEDVRAYPVRLLESGPAAGVMAAHLTAQLGEKLVLSFDMGGTTAKGAIIADGVVRTVPELEVDRLERFKPGSGLPVVVPAIDLVEVGAGGGSIAFVDGLGRLRVGPESAGAEPGPACYGRGGTDATVTDADLLLGFLNPELFAGGDFSLDVGAAYEAVGALAHRLGVGTLEAAWGIHTVVNENMAQAFRIHALERGVDIRRCTLVAFGGAGPVHATGLAEALGIRKVVVPRTGSVFSAQGLVETPASFELMRTHLVPLDRADWNTVYSLFAELERECVLRVERASGGDARLITERALEMRYIGQQRQLRVPFPEVNDSRDLVSRLAADFAQAYRARYAQAIRDLPVEVVNLWVRVSVGGSVVRKAAPTGGRAANSGVIGRRRLWFGEDHGMDATVYLWDGLRVGEQLTGPACIDDATTTVVVRPGWVCQVTEGLNLVLTRQPEATQ